MRDFFSSHIRNANTHRAYIDLVRQFICLLRRPRHWVLPIPPTKEQDIAPSTKARAGTEHGYWIVTLNLPLGPGRIDVDSSCKLNMRRGYSVILD
jgi:hypothetical protein